MDSKLIRLLVVEDSRTDAIMIEELLSGAKTVHFELVSVNRLSSAIGQLEQSYFDIILLDLSLPDTRGLDTLIQVQNHAPTVPIVVLTALNNEELAVEAIRKGAQDYLVKGQIDSQLLVRAIRYAIERKSTLEALRDSEERFRLLVDSGKDYAIFTLSPNGTVINWNQGAERMTGYRADEIVGENFRCFYLPGDMEANKPERQLHIAASEGQLQEENWRWRKDGSQFWAAVTLTALRDESGQLRGFAKFMHDRSDRQRSEAEIRKLHDDLKRRALELEVANKELEAFNYSVSHDLRNPLSIIDGFSWVLQQKYADKIDEKGQHYMQLMRGACKRMGHLIEDLLHLASVTKREMKVEKVDLSALVQKIIAQFQQAEPQRHIELHVVRGAVTFGDERLLQIALENLLGNAWKYTRKKQLARIEFGVLSSVDSPSPVFFVRDNGAGFSMADAEKLFVAFHRLHGQSEFEGTGVGLATVQRIIHRHGGEIWASAAVDRGASFYFTIKCKKMR